MLQALLARDHLMCGLGTNLDPSVDLENSGVRGTGCRPTIFFGPQRDALSLITKQIHSALILRPKGLRDFETKAYVLSFPAGDLSTLKNW